jgi:hypothetical protein
MMTSYFAKAGNMLTRTVSIAGKAPDGYVLRGGRQYKKLAPKFWFFEKYKRDGDEAFYTEQYQKEVLDRLDPKQVYEDLGENAIILCYEKPGSFCHRHLVARWLEKNLGITINELE